MHQETPDKINAPARTEIRSLTGLRGVAAIYVALYHYLRFFPVNFKNPWVFSFLMHGYLSVDLFFLLSAFVLTLSNRFGYGVNKSSYKRFMLKRWVRIYPSYFIVLSIGYFLVYHFPYRLPNFLLSLSLLSLLFNKAVLFLHLWSLEAEFITYAIFPVLLIMTARMKRAKNSVLFFVSISLYLLSIYASGQKITNAYSLDVYEGRAALIRCFAGYLFGIIVINIYQSALMAFFTNRKTLYAVVGLLASAVFFPKADLLIVVLFIPLMVGVARGGSIITSFLQSKLIYFLGLISYPLYLIHYIILWRFDLVNRLLARLHLSQFPLCGYLMVVLLSATVFTFYIEKPIVTYLSSRLMKPSVATA